MSGFHKLRIQQKAIFKLHNIMGYCKWVTDAGVIAAGSADADVKGRHFYRDMRMNKALFRALVKHSVETLTSKYQEFKIYF